MSDEPPSVQPVVSVVICAYTEARWDDLLAAIESIRVQRDRVALEIIVVIDHNAALLERIRAVGADLIVTENGEARGLSGARNSGLRLATAEIVAFMDDDAMANPDWLERLVPTYDDPAVGGAGGTIDPIWETSRPSWWPVEFDWVVGCTYRGMPEGRAVVRNMIGCNMSFRRDLLRDLGGFVHGIGRIGTRPLGAEETELSIRLGRRWPDRTIIYEPSAVVRHRVPASRSNFRYFRSRCYAEGLSKAAVAKLVGAGNALSTERGYAVRTLGGGVLSELGRAVRGDRSAIGRAGAMVAGLTITTAGYIVGRIAARPNATAPGKP